MTIGRRVLTIGSAMVDTIAVIEDEFIERMSMNNADRSYLLLEEGQKTEASLVSTHPGGGAINAAVSFARLGFTVATLVKCGRDARAQFIRSALQSAGVSDDFIVETGAAATGASVLISAHEKNAAIFTFRGANSMLERSELRGEAFDQDIVYVTSLSDRSADVFPEIVVRAAERKAFVAANPGIRQLSARGEAFQKAISSLSLLSMNRSEAAALVPRLIEKCPRPERRLKPAAAGQPMDLMRRGFSVGGFEMSLPHFIEALAALGPKCILVTDGNRGAYAAAEGEITFCPSLSVQVVGTAGAGDAFTSTFAAMRARGASPGEALQFASINAGSVVQFGDTQTGLLTAAELKKNYEVSKEQLELRTWQLI